MVWYRIKESRACTEQDYSDFLRRTRWKAYQAKHRRTNVGNFLEILWPRSHERDTPWSGGVGVTPVIVYGNSRSGTEIDPCEYGAWTAGAWRHKSTSGPWPMSDGMDVIQCCTWAAKCANLALLCSVKWGGQGNVCEVYEYSVRERGGSKDTVMWESDNVPCPMNTLTSETKLTVAVTYVLECKQCTWIKVCRYKQKKKNPTGGMDICLLWVLCVVR